MQVTQLRTYLIRLLAHAIEAAGQTGPAELVEVEAMLKELPEFTSLERATLSAKALNALARQVDRFTATCEPDVKRARTWARQLRAHERAGAGLYREAWRSAFLTNPADELRTTAALQNGPLAFEAAVRTLIGVLAVLNTPANQLQLGDGSDDRAAIEAVANGAIQQAVAQAATGLSD